MSDELEGWNNCGACSVFKIIGHNKYTITPTGAEFVLSIESTYRVAARETLHEAQHLAHATARLWAGDLD